MPERNYGWMLHLAQGEKPKEKKYRRHALVAILILSAVITPPDVISQLLVTIPIYTLYELGILVVKSVEKKRLKELNT